MAVNTVTELRRIDRDLKEAAAHNWYKAVDKLLDERLVIMEKDKK